MVTQTNINYDLLVLCIPCEQRPLVYHEKQRPLVSPRKMFMCPHDKSAIIIEICLFTKNLRSRLQSMRTSRKTDFRKQKRTLVSMTYHNQRPQCPSLSPHVLLLRPIKLRLLKWLSCSLKNENNVTLSTRDNTRSNRNIRDK